MAIKMTIPGTLKNMRRQLREAYSESNDFTYVRTALEAYAQKWFAIHEQLINSFELVIESISD